MADRDVSMGSGGIYTGDNLNLSILHMGLTTPEPEPVKVPKKSKPRPAKEPA